MAATFTPAASVALFAMVHDNETPLRGEMRDRVFDAMGAMDDATADAAQIALEAALGEESYRLMRHYGANPHNLPGVPRFPALCPHDAAAMRAEAQGRAAYVNGGRNPYNPGTMANTRFAIGWHQMDNANA